MEAVGWVECAHESYALAYFLPPKHLKMKEILDEVARETGVSAAAIKGRRQFTVIVRARHIFMHRAYATGCYSLPRIGRFLGRHHTTVLNGVRRQAARLAGGSDDQAERLRRAVDNHATNDADKVEMQEQDVR